MGHHLRPDDYRAFVRLPPDDLPIESIRTSCAVFVRAVLHHAGRPVTRRGKPGIPIFRGWLEGLDMRCSAWIDADAPDEEPLPGDIFYRAYSKSSKGFESHVGVFVEEEEGTQWLTAEGGGSDARSPTSAGTVCRLEHRNPYDRDRLGRKLIGWWRPALMDGWIDLEADTDPAPPAEPTT